MDRRPATPAGGVIYGVKTQQPSASRPSSGHYYDEPDGYLGDFSESDALSGRPEDAVTEIYRRKPQTSVLSDPYGRHLYYPTG